MELLNQNLLYAALLHKRNVQKEILASILLIIAVLLIKYGVKILKLVLLIVKIAVQLDLHIAQLLIIAKNIVV